MPKLRFKGINIHYTDQGKGSAIVLVHGFLESIWMWKDIAPVLAKKHRVICIDLPGHGQSDCIGYVHSMEEMAEAVYHVLKNMRIRKATLVGHSMGGYVVLAFAEQYPDNVRSLVLYQSTAKADSEAKKLDRVRASQLIKENHITFVKHSISFLFRPVNRTKFKLEIEALTAEALKTTKQGIIAALAGMRDRPSREILLKFPPYPVHIIASDKDPRIPLEEAESLAAISAAVHLHIIRGCGHMSYIEDLPASLSALKRSVD